MYKTPKSVPTMKTLGGKGASDAPAEKAAEEAAPKAPEAPKAVDPENAETEPLFEETVDFETFNLMIVSDAIPAGVKLY